ncbi:MAG: proton-conducting transporter membrane subunit [Vicinamibacterales bacterium]
MNADLTSLVVVAPLLVPLAAAVAASVWAGRPRVQQAIGLGGAILLLGAALVLARAVAAAGQVRTALGGWDAPFAIEFVADGTGASLVVLAAVMGLAALLFQQGDADPAPASPAFVPLVHAFLAGACGAFMTGDLFNLYVWFEVVLIASLGLLVLGKGRRHLDGALTSFVLNVVGTLFVLMGVALVYATAGHLNYAAIARATMEDPLRFLPFVAVLSAGFLLKAGAFPLFAWLPATYHTLPAPALALFAALGTKVGVYALLRTETTVFPTVAPLMGDVLGWVAVVTMVTGVLGAAYHWDVRRILAFHSISQIGYILLGIALGTPGGAQGALVFALHHSLVKGSLFLIAALVCREAGSYDLRNIGGLFNARPWLAALFLLQALSLVGIPPLSGFWAKFLVVRETLILGHLVWAATALAVGALTLYSMLKIWMEAFWRAHPREDWQPPTGARPAPAIAATFGLAAVTTAFGLWPEPVLRFTFMAATVLHTRP